MTACKGVFRQKKEVPNEIVTKNVEDLKDTGYYIMNQKTKVTESFFSEGITFSSNTNTANPDRVIWEIDRDHMIPVVDKNKKLIYVNTKSIPSSITLEKFTDVGYTIGLRKMKVSEDTGDVTVEIYNQNYKAGSDMLVKGLNANLNIRSAYATIYSINGKRVTADDITPCGSFYALDKKKEYDLVLYQGTKYIELSVIADTRIFFSSDVYSITEYEYTKDGYIILTIPSYVPSGYYRVGTSGLFYYDKEEGDEE